MLWALLGALFVGLSLGLLGSGGAILTVPILVYLVKHSEKAAIVESLAIVGSIAFVSAVRALYQRNVDLRIAMILIISGIPGTYLGVHLAAYVTGSIQLAILAILMCIAAALIFIAPAQSASLSPSSTPDGVTYQQRPKLPAHAKQATVAKQLGVVSILNDLLQGATLGLITGLVGVGGGFLIIPLLILVRKLPMATAVGTSLVIITLNSATGFLKYQMSSSAPDINWQVIVLFSSVGILTSQLGMLIAPWISQTLLKRTFAAFLICMAVFILVRQHPQLLPEHLKHPPSENTNRL